MLVLNKSAGFSRKPASKDLVVSNYGSSKYDHIKKATEQLMRQQHSDKTELEIAVCKVNTLEQEKNEQIEINAKLLEQKVKLEALTQSGKSQFGTLKFDFVATQNLSTHVQEFFGKTEKTTKFIIDEIVALKAKHDQTRREVETYERFLEQEISTNRSLNVTVEALTSDKHQLLLKDGEAQKRIQELTAKIESCIAEFEEQLKKSSEDNSARLATLTNEMNEAHGQEVRLNQLLEQKSTELAEQLRRITALETEKEQLTEVQRTELSSLTEQIEQKNAQVQEGLFKFEQIQTELNQATNNIASLTEKLQQSERLVEEYQLSANSTSGATAELEKENASVRTQLATKETEIEELTSKLSKLTIELQEEKNSSSKFKEELSIFQEELEKSNNALAEAKKATEDAVKTAAQTKKDLDNTQERLNLAKNEVASLQKINASRMSVNEQNALIDQLKANVEAANDEVDTVNRLAEEKINKKQEELNNVRAGYQMEVRKLDDKYKQQIADYAKREAEAAKEKADLEEQLQSLKAAQPDTAHKSSDNKKTPTNSKKGDEPKGDKNKDSAEEAEEDRPDSESQKEVVDKRASKKQTSLSEFLIKPKDVPVGDPPRTRSSDSAPASQEDASQKKRKLQPKASAPASPVKKVHFSEPVKKIEPKKVEPKKTYSRPRKAPVKTKATGDMYEDIFTFKG